MEIIDINLGRVLQFKYFVIFAWNVMIKIDFLAAYLFLGLHIYWIIYLSWK